MKTKKNFVLRQVAGSYVVLSIAEATVDFDGMLNLNESGLLLWKLLEQGATLDSLANALFEEYEVTYDKALADVTAFVGKLRDAGCIED
ncbi:MAG: PqqD family protein [Clostridia bacterium]|nr:PqqD family protein [Clostridia bacterium]